MTPYHVPTSAVPLLQDPPFVLWLGLLGLGLGRRALRVLRLTGPDFALERGVIALSLGFGLLQYVGFGLGMAGKLTPGAVWVALGVLSVILLPDSFLALRSLLQRLRALASQRPPKLIGWAALVVAVPLLLAFVSALAPPTDPDGLYYHLTAPERWLQLGRLDYLPTLVHTNGLMGVNMLYTLALAVWSDTAAKLIHFALGILSLLAIFALGRQLKTSLVGFAAAAFWFIGLYAIPTLDASRLFSWAYVDLGLTAQAMTAVLAWLLWSRTQRFGFLVAAGLCAGFSATAKLTGVFVGAGLTVVVLVDTLRQKRGARAALLNAVVFGALAVLPALPWFVRSFVLTGSPVYLMLPKLFKTRDWTPEAGAAFNDYFKYYVWGTGYRSLGWSLELRKAFRAVVMLSTLGGAALVIWRLKNWEHRFLAFVFALLVLACVSSTGLYVRYMVPFLPLALVLLFIPLHQLLRERTWAQVALLLVLAGNAALYVRGANPSVSDVVQVSSGRLSRHDFVERQIPVLGLWEHANAVVPADAKILLVAGRPSYFINAYCYVTEAYYQARIRMDTYENFVSDVRRDKLKYVIIPDSMAPSAPIGPAYAPAKNEMPFAHRLVNENGRLLKTVATDHLYELAL